MTVRTVTDLIVNMLELHKHGRIDEFVDYYQSFTGDDDPNALLTKMRWADYLVYTKAESSGCGPQ